MTIFGHFYGNWAPAVPKNLVFLQWGIQRFSNFGKKVSIEEQFSNWFQFSSHILIRKCVVQEYFLM